LDKTSCSLVKAKLQKSEMNAMQAIHSRIKLFTAAEICRHQSTFPPGQVMTVPFPFFSVFP
jgi:hypothetical protein